jgi:hypothetical protein
VPSDSVSNRFNPASTPTIAVVAAAVTAGTTTRSDTNQRPARSCDTVTVDGTAPSGNGRDHTTARGSSISFASRNSPGLWVKALAVNSADRRDLLRDFNRGYRHSPLKYLW